MGFHGFFGGSKGCDWNILVASKLTASSPFLSKKTSPNLVDLVASLKLTAIIAPENRPENLPQKDALIFQPSIFRCKLDVSFREGNRRDQRVFGKQPVKLLGWLVGKGRRCGASYNSQVYPKQVSNEKRGPWLFSVYRGLYCPVTI